MTPMTPMTVVKKTSWRESLRAKMIAIKDRHDLTYPKIAAQIPDLSPDDLRSFASRGYLDADKLRSLEDWTTSMESCLERPATQPEKALPMPEIGPTNTTQEEPGDYPINSLYREILCHHCNFRVPGQKQGFHFCGICGAALSRECPRCHARFPRHTTICPNDGAILLGHINSCTQPPQPAED